MVKRSSLTAVLLSLAVLAVGGVALAATINGTSGNDSLVGSAFDDRIEAREGDDRVSGLGGRDEILGGDGHDVLDGEGEPRSLSPQPVGPAAGDWIHGGLGNDTLRGGVGNDHLIGGGDSDILIGGPGPDHLYGDLEHGRTETVGSDTIVADGDNGASDTIKCGFGTADKVRADRNDQFVGGSPAAAGCEQVELEAAVK